MRRIDKGKLADRLTGTIGADIESGRISGAAALVMQSGRIVARTALGYADLRTGAPIKLNSIFRLASMTKPITAIAALIAEERGLIEIDAPIGDYLPRFSEIHLGRIEENGNVARGERAKAPIRIIDLLTNTAGFLTGRVGWSLDGDIPAEKKKSLLTYVDGYADKMLLDFEPSTAFGYSGRGGFDLVAAAIEVMADMPYQDFVKKNITAPLGLSDLTYHPSEEQWLRTVGMHTIKDGVPTTTDRLLRKGFDGEYVSGGSGLVSTIGDYAVIAEMLRCGGIYDGVKILSRESAKRLTASAGLPGGWGLGVRTVKNDRYLPDGAYGWSGVFGGHFFVDPQNEIVAVYLKNSYHDCGSEASTARRFEEDIYTSLL